MKSDHFGKALFVFVVLAGICITSAQGTAFTYQGTLRDGAGAANGTYDFRFIVFDVSVGGSPIAPPITNSGVVVSNGLFTTILDFGGGLFNGNYRWLGISVRTNGAAAFSALSSRQPITPSPYSVFSTAAARVTDGIIQNPLFFGTTGNTPLDLSVNNQRALRLVATPNSVNVIEGFSGNVVAPGIEGASIGGGGIAGGPNRVLGQFGTIGGGFANLSSNSQATVGGGGFNVANGVSSTVGGGFENRALQNDATIAGGYTNTAFGLRSTVGGGAFNVASNQYTVVGGGNANVASGDTSVVGGGVLNVASGSLAAIGGGAVNTAGGLLSFVGGGQNNAAAGTNTTIGGGFFNFNQGTGGFIGAGVGNRNYALNGVIGGGDANFANNVNVTIGGGGRNVAVGVSSAILGGYENQALNTDATVGGGYTNFVSGYRSTIAGGALNVASGHWTVISGGESNSVLGDLSTISGGNFNVIRSNSRRSVIGGGQSNTCETNSGLSTIGGGYGNFIAEGSFYYPQQPELTNISGSVIGGGSQNRIDSLGLSTIGGGSGNTCSGTYGTIGGGAGNIIDPQCSAGVIAGGINNHVLTNSRYATVGGGSGNVIGLNVEYATIGGGGGNTTAQYYATVSGGRFNVANGLSSTVAGGYQNFAGNTDATVSGGYSNVASGYRSTVPGGTLNTASSDYTFAAGRRAKADDDGSFVWADSSDFDFHSTTTNQFNVRSTGGVRIVTGLNAGGTPSAGVSLAANDTSWNVISDRAAKKNFQPENVRQVLERLTEVPVQRWNYQWESETTPPHLGPTAQDFKAAFYPGRDDKSISTLEFDGVALAAIQGLNQKLEEKTAIISAMEKRLAELEKLVTTLADKK